MNVQSFSRLLATTHSQTVQHVLQAGAPQTINYLAYGHRSGAGSAMTPMGFNGERVEVGTGHYILGKGYRVFNSVLGRFQSCDSWSPFGEGGINAYAYCAGDPINYKDPSGRVGAVVYKPSGPIKPVSPTLHKKIQNSLSKETVVTPEQRRAQDLFKSISDERRIGIEKGLQRETAPTQAVSRSQSTPVDKAELVRTVTAFGIADELVSTLIQRNNTLHSPLDVTNHPTYKVYLDYRRQIGPNYHKLTNSQRDRFEQHLKVYGRPQR